MTLDSRSKGKTRNKQQPKGSKAQAKTVVTEDTSGSTPSTTNSPSTAAVSSNAPTPENDDRSLNETGQANAAPVAPAFIVGIGASAGGLQPLELFFRTVDPDAGNAYVVIQHLSPDFKSLMHELLGRQTTMTVMRAKDGMAVHANCVYLIPPGFHLRLLGQHLQLERYSQTSGAGLHFPIDVFFRSLAKSAGVRSVGIILSGTGTDGSRGIRAIDEAGGLVYAQDPATAQFDGMLIAARATGIGLQSLSPDQIAHSVCALASRGEAQEVIADDVPATNDLHNILSAISNSAGVDFNVYKPSTLRRRIERRMALTGCTTPDDYFAHLQSSTDESDRLRADLLISVTSFFRDRKAWEVLSNSALPALIESVPANMPLRVWVAACSTGEEAYTMAMVVREALNAAGRQEQPFKLFATDVNKDVLDRAASGVYPSSVAADIPRALLDKYFTVDGDNYVVARPLREMIIFSRHNILTDAPFIRTHLISFRNALIYFQPPAQTRAISMMHFSLVQNGILFLGSSESVGAMESEFKAVKRHWCVYRKTRDVRLPLDHGLNTRPVEVSGATQRSQPMLPMLAPERMLREGGDALATANDWVCLYCDGGRNLLHVLGEDKGYLRVPRGGLSTEVTRLVADELSIPLRAAMNRAQRGRKVVDHRGIRVAGVEPLVDVQVLYRPTSKTLAELFIVVLKPSRVVEADVDKSTADVLTAQQLNELEYELAQTRENLQATIEELESTNEEQQATNEELTAANEELQSTNEELHSVNEELHTVNSEYQSKITELTEVTNDIDNLLESTDIGVVFLDNELRIRKFTPAATRDVNLLPADIGRSFDDLAYHFDYPNLNEDMRRVLALGEAVEKEVESRTSEHLLVRIHPYRAGRQLAVGIVLTFVNISDMKRIENALAQVETRYQQLFQAEMFGIMLGDLRTRQVVDANDAYLELLQLTRADLPLDLRRVYAESEHANLEQVMKKLEESGKTAPTPVLKQRLDGTPLSVIVGRTLVSESEGTYVGFVLDTGASPVARNDGAAAVFAGTRHTDGADIAQSVDQIVAQSEELLATCGDTMDDNAKRRLQVLVDACGQLQQRVR
jgi:two-component system CheB/CheR fusion protein